MTTTKHPPHMGTMSQVPFNLSFLLNRGYTIQPNNQIIEKTETGYYSLTYLQHQATRKLKKIKKRKRDREILRNQSKIRICFVLPNL